MIWSRLIVVCIYYCLLRVGKYTFEHCSSSYHYNPLKFAVVLLIVQQNTKHNVLVISPSPFILTAALVWHSTFSPNHEPAPRMSTPNNEAQADLVGMIMVLFMRWPEIALEGCSNDTAARHISASPLRWTSRALLGWNGGVLRWIRWMDVMDAIDWKDFVF